MQNTVRQTSKWQLRGATYKENDLFYFVGDTINGYTQLVFDVNGAQKTVKVPAPLKNLDTYYDEIKNGVVHYNIKSFEVDQHTILAIDDSWLQTSQTVICYCHLPYEARSNTPILCDKLNVVGGMITKTEDCGVKVINKVLALRLPVQKLGITPDDTQDIYLEKFNAYLKENPFTVLYCLVQSDSQLLEDYSFDIRNADNDITCQTRFAPSYFNVDYPVDVIINTSVDVKEVQELVKQVKETKLLIDAIKEDLDNKTEITDKQYHIILEIQEKIDTQMAAINAIHEAILNAQDNVTQALEQVNALKAEITELAAEVRDIAQSVNASINTHDSSPNSHQDIRELVKQSNNNSSNKIQQHNLNGTAHEDIRLLIEEVDQKIDFDFGNY